MPMKMLTMHTAVYIMYLTMCNMTNGGVKMKSLTQWTSQVTPYAEVIVALSAIVEFIKAVFHP